MGARAGGHDKIYYYGEPGRSVWTSDVNMLKGQPLNQSHQSYEYLRSGTHSEGRKSVSGSRTGELYSKRISSTGGLYSERNDRVGELYSSEGRGVRTDGRKKISSDENRKLRKYILELEERCDDMTKEIRRYSEAAVFTKNLQSHLSDTQCQLEEATRIIGRLAQHSRELPRQSDNATTSHRLEKLESPENNENVNTIFKYESSDEERLKRLGIDEVLQKSEGNLEPENSGRYISQDQERDLSDYISGGKLLEEQEVMSDDTQDGHIRGYQSLSLYRSLRSLEGLSYQ